MHAGSKRRSPYCRGHCANSPRRFFRGGQPVKPIADSGPASYPRASARAGAHIGGPHHALLAVTCGRKFALRGATVGHEWREIGHRDLSLRRTGAAVRVTSVHANYRCCPWLVASLSERSRAASTSNTASDEMGSDSLICLNLAPAGNGTALGAYSHHAGQAPQGYA